MANEGWSRRMGRGERDVDRARASITHREEERAGTGTSVLHGAEQGEERQSPARRGESDEQKRAGQSGFVEDLGMPLVAGISLCTL